MTTQAAAAASVSLSGVAGDQQLPAALGRPLLLLLLLRNI